MKKLIIAAIIAGLWLIGCSKSNPVEPNGNGGTDTNITKPDTPNVIIKDSSAVCVIMSRSVYTYAHYVAGEQNLDTAGFAEPFKYQCEKIKFIRFEDSTHFAMSYVYRNSYLVATNNGDLSKNGWIIKKIQWKKF